MDGERARGRTHPAFRRWLRELRESAGLTQEQLALAVGTDRRNVRRWEVDGHDPSATTLLRILEVVRAQVVPAPPAELPRTVDAQVRDLELRLRDAEDAAARRHDELVARLDEQAHALRVLSARRARSA